MNQEFSISTGWKIFYSFIGLVLIIFSLFLFLIPSNPGVNVSKAIYLLPVLIFAGGALLTISVFIRKIIITGDAITKINALGTRELRFDEVKGCRISDKVISIESLHAGGKKIMIGNYSDYTDSEDMVNYIKENFKDLNAAELASSEKEFAEDQRFGATADERQAALKRANAICIAYNTVGFAGGMALIFLQGNNFAVLCGAIYPLLGIALIATSQGLIKFISNRKRSVYPFIMLGFLMSSMGLLFGSMVDYYFLAPDKLFLYAIGADVVVLIPLYLLGLNREAGQPMGQVVMMLLIGLMFGFGFIRTLNCRYDFSRSVDITTPVAEKYTTSGKGAHYHIRLTPWHAGQGLKEIDISHSEYDRIQPGDPVTIHEKQGYLHMLWFYVDL